MALNGPPARVQHGMQILAGQRLPHFGVCVLRVFSYTKIILFVSTLKQKGCSGENLFLHSEVKAGIENWCNHQWKPIGSSSDLTG